MILTEKTESNLCVENSQMETITIFIRMGRKILGDLY